MYLTQSLHRAVQQNPDGLHTIDGDRQFTFREAADRIAAIAGGLRRLGVAPGDRVAVLGVNSDEYLQLLLAIPWADAVLVPVNTRWNVKEIAYSLNETDVQVMFVDSACSSLVPELRERCPKLGELVCFGRGGITDGLRPLDDLADEEPVADAHRRGDDLAGIFYTGGTTGVPKGVMLSHRNIVTVGMGWGATGTLPIGGRTMHVAPLFHLTALSVFIACSITGATHVPLAKFDPADVLQTIERNKVTSLTMVPTMLQLVVDHPDSGCQDLSSLELLLYGAAPMSDALLQRVRQTFPSTRLLQGYGMTEAVFDTVLFDSDHEDPVLRQSVGVAMPHVLVKVVDRDGSEVPRGVIGELAVSGDNRMLGYWKKPEETAEAVRDGWMHTGDGGYMDDQGHIFLVDRIKDVVISGGENVYSYEVENVIARHPAVQQVAIIGLPDQVWGERVHAVVSLAPGATLTAEELHEFCRSELAGYKCPRSMEVVTEFPMSAAGKILKRELRKRA